MLFDVRCDLPTKNVTLFWYILLIVRMPSITWRKPLYVNVKLYPQPEIQPRALKLQLNVSENCEKLMDWHEQTRHMKVVLNVPVPVKVINVKNVSFTI